MLVEPLLVPPDLDEELAIAVEMAQLLRVYPQYHNDVIVGALLHAASCFVALIAEDLHDF